MSEPGVEQIRAGPAPRVLHVITDAGPHPYFRTLIQAGRLDPSSVIVGCVGREGALHRDMQELGVPSFSLGAASRTQYPRAIIKLARLLRSHRVDIVQTHLVDGCLVGLAAARVAHTPVAVMTAHHSHELPFHGRRLVWPERLCAGPLSDHIIAPSHQVADVLHGVGGVPLEKIEVVHHGFDLARLDPAHVSGAAVRHELGLEGKLVIGAIGRIYPLKNYVALIQAFAGALSSVAEARLVIVGGGDAEPLRQAAKAAGVSRRVILPGPREDIPEVLAALDLFVHPAIAESFGMVIVEAMAMSRPVLSTAVGIAPEVIEEGVTGWLAASSSTASLVDALWRVIRARGTWEGVGLAGHNRVNGFTASAMAGSYERLYREWLQARALGI